MPEPAEQVSEWLADYGDPSSCVAHLLCDRHPAGRTALLEVGEDLEAAAFTFGDLAERSRRRAAGLAAAGVRRGDRVATLLGRGAELAVTALAVWRLGAVHVPLLTALAPQAVRQRLEAAGVGVAVCEPGEEQRVAPGAGPGVRVVAAGPGADGSAAEAAALGAPVAVGGDAAFLHLFAPGTTGGPQGFDVPVRALAALHSHHAFGLDVREDDVFWNAHDPSWTYGLYYGLVTPLLAGQCSVQLRAAPDPELTLEVLVVCGVTNLVAPPTLYRTLQATMKAPPAELGVRRLSSAGQPLPAEVSDWARDMFGVAVHDHYGQAELGICVGQHQHADAAGELRAASLGRALPGYAVAVLDPLDDVAAPAGRRGRVAVDAAASPVFWFGGYVSGAGAGGGRSRFSPDGRWFLTGDTGAVDREGYFYFATRDDEAILSGGYRIVPVDVEQALQEHAGVQEAAVYGAPDEVEGQVVAATVVLAPGWSGSTEMAEELRDLVRTRFAEHAYPRMVEFVAELPKSPSGKIRRSRLGARRTR
ncbi:AMP-binding protein [Nocardiopsis coralliicola]